MNSDSAFIIGATHEVCQDFAVAGGGSVIHHGGDTASSGGPYVIVSDGCSSSPDTDTGARLLVKAAQGLMRSSEQLPADCLQGIHEEAARLALARADLIGLCPQAVDATLLTAHLCNGTAIIACSGDGVVVLQSRTGLTDVYSISYTSGYPLYPSYAHQPERLRLIEGGGSSNAKEVKHFRVGSDGKSWRLQDSLISDSRVEIFTRQIQECQLAAVLSDGIHSFFTARKTETTKRVEAIPMWEALKELVSFKSTHGAFVKRRLKRFKGHCQLKGWRHLDDLAVGVIYMGD